MAKIPEGGEVETVPDSEPSSPKMEVEEQTQTDETTKPEEAKRLYAEIKDQDKATAAGQIAAQKLQGGAAPAPGQPQ